MSMDLDEQYDKIYRYCYHKLCHRESAEDVTQETFLRYFRTYGNREQNLPLLYTIARNLCIDEFRSEGIDLSEETEPQSGFEDTLLQNMVLQAELNKLTAEDRELLLLRYANEVPLADLCKLYGASRFALYRRCSKLLAELRKRMEGDNYE